MKGNHNKLNVVYTIDKNYLFHFCASLTSLLESNLDLIDKVYVVTDYESKYKFQKIKKFYKSKFDIQVLFLKTDLDNFKGLPITHHLTIATYFRLLIDIILPSTIDKVLLLDSDTIIQGSIGDLCNISFGENLQNNHYLYAVNHKLNYNQLKRLNNINYDSESGRYFNAGVLLINLKKWRDEKIHQLLLNNSKKYFNYLLWADQDILNITFEKKWGELDYRYNVFDTINNFEESPVILHFAGSTKPWSFKSNHPYTHKYIYYRNRSPFKYNYLESINLELILNKLKSVMVKFFNFSNLD